MKIKITDVLPIVNPPEVGSVHTVTRRETEPPRNRRTKMYYIEVGKREIGVYTRECKVIEEYKARINKWDLWTILHQIAR